MTAQEPTPSAPITGLSHVQLLVTDVEVSARWYSTVLSLVPYAEDLSMNDVAAHLVCSPRTVENQLRLARQRLAAALRQSEESDE